MVAPHLWGLEVGAGARGDFRVMLRPTCGAWKLQSRWRMPQRMVAPHLWGLEALDMASIQIADVAPHLWGLEVQGASTLDAEAVAPHLWGLEAT